VRKALAERTPLSAEDKEMPSATKRRISAAVMAGVATLVVALGFEAE
jgi:hypothetical protein